MAAVAARMPAAGWRRSRQPASAPGRVRAGGRRAQAALARAATAPAEEAGARGAPPPPRPDDDAPSWWENLWVRSSLVASRVLVSVGSLACLVLSTFLFGTGLREVLTHGAEAAMSGNAMNLVCVAVGSLDLFLLGMVCLVFGLGSFELFVSNGSERPPPVTKPRWLQIKSVDDLEQRVGELVVGVMIVSLAERGLHMTFTTPMHLIYGAIAVLFSAASLALLHQANGHHSESKPKEKQATEAKAPADATATFVSAAAPR